MIYSFKQNKIQSQDSANSMNNFFKKKITEQMLKTEGQKNIQENMTEFSAISREQLSKASFIQVFKNSSKNQLRMPNQNRYQTKYFNNLNKTEDGQQSNEQIPIVQSEAVFLNGKNDQNQLKTLRSKYDKALMENAQLLCRMQSYYQQICTLQSTIRSFKSQIMEREEKIKDMNQINQSLQISLNELHSSYKSKINELTLQLESCKCWANTITRSQLNTLRQNEESQNRTYKAQNLQQNYEKQNYPQQIRSYEDQIRAFDHRMFVMQEKDHHTQIQPNVKRSNKLQFQDNQQLKRQLSQLKIEVQQLKRMATGSQKTLIQKQVKQQSYNRSPTQKNLIMRNVSVPSLLRTQTSSPDHYHQTIKRKEIISNNKFNDSRQNKEFKWKDLQQRIHELKNQNQFIQKQLHRNF